MFSLDNGREIRFLTRSKVCAVPSGATADAAVVVRAEDTIGG